MRCWHDAKKNHKILEQNYSGNIEVIAFTQIQNIWI